MSERIKYYDDRIEYWSHLLTNTGTREVECADMLQRLEQARYWAKRSENEELSIDDGLGDGCHHMLGECVNGIAPVDASSICIICPHRDGNKSGEHGR